MKTMFKDTGFASLSLLLALNSATATSHTQATQNKTTNADISITKSAATDRHAIAYASYGANGESSDFEIYLASADGKSRVQVTQPPNNGGGYLAWSPDGQRLAFYKKYDDKKTWSIHTVNRDGSHWQRLTFAKGKWDSSPTWSPDGSKIVFARAYKDSQRKVHKELWVMNADGSGKQQITALRGGGPYFAPDGQLLFHSEQEGQKSEIAIANIDGSNVRQLTQNQADEWHPEVSPDGQHIVFSSNRDGNYEIYRMKIDGSQQTRLTFSPARDSMPSWSPDGSQLIFTSNPEDLRSVYIMNSDGSNIRELVNNAWQPAWYKRF